MLADTTSRPDVEESYSAATSTSNLRVTSVRRTPADMVIAAGMNTHRTGMALLRLQSEWDCSAKPLEPTTAQIEALASSYPIEPPGSEHAGKVKVDCRYILPLQHAQEVAAGWHQHELGLLLQSLKTLPYVRASLVHWMLDQGVQDPVHVVASTLLWWLSPKCPVCRGVGQRVANGRKLGRPCGSCKGTGERTLGHQGTGRKLLAYIRGCIGDARNGLQVRFKHQKAAPRAEAPELLVLPGQRWRSRDGRLWDIRRADNQTRDALLARLVTNPEITALYRSNGWPHSQFRTGPTGSDLVEMVGSAQ